MDFGAFIGLPFADNGRTRDGLDCWGLVRLVYRDVLGIDLPSYSADYPDSRASAVIADQVVRHEVKAWQACAPEPMAVVLFAILSHPSHVGIVIDPRRRRMLHIAKGVNSCVECWDTPKWSARMAGVYRWAGA